MKNKVIQLKILQISDLGLTHLTPFTGLNQVYLISTGLDSLMNIQDYLAVA